MVRLSDSSSVVNASDETMEYEILDAHGFFHQFRYLNNQLNKSNPEVRVNFLDYMQTDPKGKEIVFSWVTNYPNQCFCAYERRSR